jgi:hypothetical protein
MKNKCYSNNYILQTAHALLLSFTMTVLGCLYSIASFAVDLQQFINNAEVTMQQAASIDFLNPEFSFPISKNAINELGKFDGLNQQSAQLILKTIDRLLINQGALLQKMAQNKSNNKVQCSNLSQVSIEPATAYSEFNDSLLKISITACLKNIRADRAAEAFLSPQFNLAAFSQVDSFNISGNYLCQQNNVKFKGKSIYCSQPTIYKGQNGLIVIKNSMASNANNSDVPIYMKESLILFQPTPRGLIYQYISYSRSVDINRFLKSVILDTITQAQRNSIPVLVEKAR